VADLWLYWQARGHLGEGRHWLAVLLPLAPRDEAITARALWVAGYLAVSQGDAGAGAALLDEALLLAREMRNRQIEAFALQYLGLAALFRLDWSKAAALLQQSVEVHEEVGEAAGAFALADLGIVEAMQGAFQKASDLLETSLRMSVGGGDEWTQAHALWALGLVALRLGHHGLARDRLRSGLRLFGRIDERTGIARAVVVLAAVSTAQARYEEAATLLGAALALYESIPAPVPAPITELVEASTTAARSKLAPPLFESAHEAGGRMSRAEATAFALGESAPAAAPPVGRTSDLTRRELEVASAVAEGLTNRQIARRLVIAETTVETHVTHVMNKLGLDSRSQIARWVHLRLLPGQP